MTPSISMPPWTVTLARRTRLPGLGVLRASSLAALLLILPAVVVGDDVTVEAVGLQVVTDHPELERTVFGSSGGTKVALLASRAGGGIISFDEEASRLEQFADDQGRSLLGESSFGNGFGSFPAIEDSGARLLLELEASGRPEADAKSIRAKGTLVVAVSLVTETHRSGPVELKEGAEIDAGPIPLRISAVGSPEWGEEPLAITLVADREIDEIKSIRILGNDGEPIDFQSGSSGSMNMMGSVTVTREYKFPEEHSALTFEIEYWTGLSQVEIPFDLTVDVGL